MFVVAEMLQSEESRRLEMAVRCMEALCVNADPFWRDIMGAGQCFVFPAANANTNTVVNMSYMCIYSEVHTTGMGFSVSFLLIVSVVRMCNYILV